MSTPTVVLIPAYEPDDKLIDLLVALHTADPDLAVLVVDDGSGPSYRAIFASAAGMGCSVIRHTGNLGKGDALKTGLAHIRQCYPGSAVVCADSDGQHSAVDIMRVAERVRQSSFAIVLGQRNFAGPDVPARSRFGNSATRWLFRLSTGRRIQDTQTGLRGYPAGLLRWLQGVQGERYEYELNVLLQAVDAGIAIETVDICTIYLEQNKSSHFRPLVDSARIYAPLLKFAASSLAAFAIDTATLLLLNTVTGSLLLSVAGARVTSSVVNFATNRRVVFEQGRQKRTIAAAVQYFALVLALLGLNYATLLWLQTVGLALLPAKLITELVLFAVSFAVQRRVVFRAPIRGGSAATTTNTSVTVGELEKSPG